MTRACEAGDALKTLRMKLNCGDRIVAHSVLESLGSHPRVKLRIERGRVSLNEVALELRLRGTDAGLADVLSRCQRWPSVLKELPA